MFTSDVREAKQDEVKMEGVDPDALWVLVQYAYTGTQTSVLIQNQSKHLQHWDELLVFMINYWYSAVFDIAREHTKKL